MYGQVARHVNIKTDTEKLWLWMRRCDLKGRDKTAHIQSSTTVKDELYKVQNRQLYQ